jgi:chorismate mutase
MMVPDGLKLCIRVLIHWNTSRTAREIIHVYLRGAKSLRPDRKTLPQIPLDEIDQAVKDFNMTALKYDPNGKN